eukprot:PhM_4_TR2104/c0_g2_i2/m.6383
MSFSAASRNELLQYLVRKSTEANRGTPPNIEVFKHWVIAEGTDEVVSWISSNEGIVLRSGITVPHRTGDKLELQQSTANFNNNTINGTQLSRRSSTSEQATYATEQQIQRERRMHARQRRRRIACLVLIVCILLLAFSLPLHIAFAASPDRLVSTSLLPFEVVLDFTFIVALVVRRTAALGYKYPTLTFPQRCLVYLISFEGLLDIIALLPLQAVSVMHGRYNR